MTPTTTNKFYLQNGGIHGKSPLSRPAYGDSGDDESDTSSEVNGFVAAGRRDPEVYERTLQSWRAAMRRPIVRMVEKESHVIAAIQVLSISGLAIAPSIMLCANDILPFHGIGSNEDPMARRLLCVHLEFGHPYILYDGVADLLLLRPARYWTRVSVYPLHPEPVASVEGLTRRVVQASVGASLGGICHVAHEGFLVFTPTVCTPGHQTQYAKFPAPMTDHH